MTAAPADPVTARVDAAILPGLRLALLLARERYAWTRNAAVIKRYAHDPQALERKRCDCQQAGDALNAIISDIQKAGAA